MIWTAVRSTLSLLLLVTGCAATPPGEGDAGAGPDPYAAQPDDFSLDVVVIAGPVRDDPRDRAVALRPAHYVVFCDGSLHWAADRRDPAQGLPPLTRVLNQRQIAGLWSLLLRLGYADPEHASDPVNAKLLAVPPGETWSLGIITGHGRRWAHISREGPNHDPDTAMAMLMEHLAGLVWSTAWTDPTADTPPRADFGPDPYARYRKP
ncbi:MAG: hypothetical protein ACYSU7_03890 [Planctomycetota bacterium]|jgi:hypothetical protein